MKITQRLLLAIALLVLAAGHLLAEKVDDLPAPTGYIDDYAHVLSPSAITRLETTARELHDKTRAQVFLVTVKTLDNQPVETFANQLFAKWHIGEKKTDRGVLMLFAISDRKRWIEIGYGLEGILNDARVGDIGREMVPWLRNANYDMATRIGFARISTAVAAESDATLYSLSDLFTVEDQPEPAAHQVANRVDNSFDWSILFPVVWFLIVGTVIVRGIINRRRGVVGTSSGRSSSGWYNGISYGSTDSSYSSDSGYSSSSSDSGSSFSGGDGGSSGGGGAGGDW